MSKFNLKEALLAFDKKTDFHYNLLATYEGCNLSIEQKKQIAEMIVHNATPMQISRRLTEALVHKHGEYEFAPLVMAKSLKIGDTVYDEETGEVLTVKEIDDSKKYWLTIKFTDRNGKVRTKQPGINFMYEIAQEGDTAYDVDDDYDIEWHPISDYFNSDFDESLKESNPYDDVYKAGYEKGDKITFNGKQWTVSDFFVDASSGKYIPMIRMYDKNDYFIRVPVSEIKKKPVKEDTIKQGNKWVNKGKEGTHGEFKTKKAADAQRKAIFASGWEESLNESSKDKFPIEYDDIEVTIYDRNRRSRETGDVPSHKWKTPYTYYVDKKDIADYIFENHFYDIFEEDYYKIADDSDFEQSFEHIEKNIDYYYNMFEDEIKEYFRERATDEAEESRDWAEVERDYFLADSLSEKVSPAGYAPKKTGKAYKVFKVRNGKLYPPMVANAGGADTPVGVWLDAEEGEFAGLSKTGRPQVKSTQSSTLSYRPGWHLGDVPRAPQFDRRNKETGEMEFPADFVWAECDYAMDVDYQKDSDEQGYMRTKVDDQGNVITYRSDKYQHSLAGLPRLPKDGYYKYRTNPRPDTVPWVITGQMKVNRLLSDDEVNEILKSKGIEPIHRQGGDKTLAELGLRG